MSVSNPSAAELVRAYLHGRSMDDGLFDAVVWMAAKRQASGAMPVLDQRLRMDIDSQAHDCDVVGRCATAAERASASSAAIG